MKRILFFLLMSSVLLANWGKWEILQDKGERFNDTKGNYYVRIGPISKVIDYMILSVEKLEGDDMMMLELKEGDFIMPNGDANIDYKFKVKIDNQQNIILNGVAGENKIIVFADSEPKLKDIINQMKEGKTIKIESLINKKNREIVIPLNNFTNSYKQLNKIAPNSILKYRR